MDITYDPIKNSRNAAKRKLPFNMAAYFDFDSALIYPDTRKEYGEVRYIGVGYIGPRLHVMVFTPTRTGLRIISLRKANQREIKANESR